MFLISPPTPVFTLHHEHINRANHLYYFLSSILATQLQPTDMTFSHTYSRACYTCHAAVSGIRDRMLTSIFCLQLARDSRYYSAVVLEEEGTMCAVVLASKLAQVRLSPNFNPPPFDTTGSQPQSPINNDRIIDAAPRIPNHPPLSNYGLQGDKLPVPPLLLSLHH